MKQTIKWHRESLANMEHCYHEKELNIKRVLDEQKLSAERISVYKAQIELAEKQGRDGFDLD